MWIPVSCQALVNRTEAEPHLLVPHCKLVVEAYRKGRESLGPFFLPFQGGIYNDNIYISSICICMYIIVYIYIYTNQLNPHIYAICQGICQIGDPFRCSLWGLHAMGIHPGHHPTSHHHSEIGFCIFTYTLW